MGVYGVLMSSEEESAAQTTHSVLSSQGPGEIQRNFMTTLTDPHGVVSLRSILCICADFCLKNSFPKVANIKEANLIIFIWQPKNATKTPTKNASD